MEEKSPKLVVGIKSGMTEGGASASSSHTGALAGSAAAYRALFDQARITRADSLEELLNTLSVFSQNPLPAGKRIAIVTNAGGLGVLATDAALENKLLLAEISKEKKNALLDFLPPSASVKNPIDILGDANGERYAKALSILSDDQAIDMFLVIVTPQTTTEAKETAEAIAALKKKSSKPVVAIFSGKESLASGFSILRKQGVATLAYPEAGMEALAKLVQVSTWHALPGSEMFQFPEKKLHQAGSAFQEAKAEERSYLSEEQVTRVLDAYGFPLLKTLVVHSREEAKKAGETLSRSPYALKILSPDIIHKSEAGGVILGVAEENLEEKYDELLKTVKEKAPQARIEGVLVMEMAPPLGEDGFEMILGVKYEPALGHLIGVGFGGIYVETLNDMAFRFAPLEKLDAREMIASLNSSALLGGLRGHRPIEIEALADCLGRLSELVTDFPEIEEIDINPLLVFPEKEKFSVLDARIKRRKK